MWLKPSMSRRKTGPDPLVTYKKQRLQRITSLAYLTDGCWWRIADFRDVVSAFLLFPARPLWLVVIGVPLWLTLRPLDKSSSGRDGADGQGLRLVHQTGHGKKAILVLSNEQSLAAKKNIFYVFKLVLNLLSVNFDKSFFFSNRFFYIFPPSQLTAGRLCWIVKWEN